jgi:hypothetical protein
MFLVDKAVLVRVLAAEHRAQHELLVPLGVVDPFHLELMKLLPGHPVRFGPPSQCEGHVGGNVLGPLLGDAQIELHLPQHTESCIRPASVSSSFRGHSLLVGLGLGGNHRLK